MNFTVFSNIWVNTGLFVFYDEKDIILCLFCSQQLGDNAFMSCGPQFFWHIKVTYHSSFSALIWNFWQLLIKFIINHNFFNNNHRDRAIFWSVITKPKAEVTRWQHLTSWPTEWHQDAITLPMSPKGAIHCCVPQGCAET